MRTILKQTTCLMLVIQSSLIKLIHLHLIVSIRCLVLVFSIDQWNKSVVLNLHRTYERQKAPIRRVSCSVDQEIHGSCQRCSRRHSWLKWGLSYPWGTETKSIWYHECVGWNLSYSETIQEPYPMGVSRNEILVVKQYLNLCASLRSFFFNPEPFMIPKGFSKSPTSAGKAYLEAPQHQHMCCMVQHWAQH